MKTLEQIDVTNYLDQKDFVSLFTSQLKLLPAEIEKLQNFYYPMYSTFVSNKVPYEKSWEIVKFIFISQEDQIKERTQNG